MKGNQLLLTIVFSALCLLLVRGFTGLEMRMCLSKKERKLYQKNVGIIDRWFFWSAPQIVKDKYSRFEKKIIHFRRIISTYKILNLSVHILFALELLFAFLYTVTIINLDILNCVCILYSAFVLFVLIVLAIIELVTNARYHRSRYRRCK